MDTEAYRKLTGFTLEDKKDNWRSLCILHAEKTPSFYIHKETYRCHCFGCGASGTIDYVLATRYRKGLNEIRKLLDIKVPILGIKKPVEEPKFCKAWLSQYKRLEMHPYLKKRGFNKTIVRLHEARWDPEGRIVFPLKHLGRDILGVGGRTVKDQEPKWLWYWHVEKSKCLYQPVDTLHVDIIVEGIFDCMWLNQHGYPGTAAILGAMPSRRQIDVIKKETNEAILFLDNDEAGRMGMEKLYKALGTTLKVTFARYPNDKKDPQELTKEELDKAIDERLTYVEYQQLNT